MIVLRFSQLPGADVESFNIYRSIIGFKAPLVSLSTLNGKTLLLKIDGGTTQTFTFDGTTPIVDLINATITGGQAFLSHDGNSFFVRSDDRCNGSVEIIGGTALGDFNLTPRVITEKSEEELIANITAPTDETQSVEYTDEDGVFQDWYRITTIDSFGFESRPTPYRQPITASGKLCILEGLVTNLQGARVPDAEVIATVQIPPEQVEIKSFITKEPVTDLTKSDGRFSLPVLQGSLIRLEVPAIGFSRNISVPEKTFEYLGDIKVDLDYQFQC